MPSNTQQKYTMTLSLNVLNHLGIGLYSNAPAVISETIANAWDADAEQVDIQIDMDKGRVTIQDDGHGMSVSDANEKYLTVGYARRDDGGAKTPNGRTVMGRKGIGKLSLFSIAKVVEVHSVKNGESHGFKMRIDDIEKSAANNVDYTPEPVDPKDIDRGTRIILTSMKRRLTQYHTEGNLKRRLARRFSVMGNNAFTIKLNGEEVTVTDRGYHDKIQYIWTFGQMGDEVAKLANNCELPSRKLSTHVEMGGENFEIDGWIGTAWKPGDLKDRASGESINGIVIMVRGKLAQENILDEFGDQNLYSEYVIGEIHADFLDLDEQDDIATTSRQRLIEDDPRYQALKRSLSKHLGTIQSEWRSRRNEAGIQVATEILPQIKEWYQILNPDHKKAAERLFGKINQLKIDDATEKGQLFISGIMAFESLRLRNLLNRLDEVSPDNLGVLQDVFMQLDDLEASAYYEITRDRLEVIDKLSQLVDDDEKERVLQEHLYNHLWLLDPSWERATHTEYMERQIRIALDGVNVSLSDDEKNSRVDIGYTTTGNKHVIVELKRASKRLDSMQLLTQIRRYYTVASKVLEKTNRSHEPLEIVCVIGQPLHDWDSTSRDMFTATRSRIVTYDELIDNASKAYKDYVEKNKQAGRIYELIKSIEAGYVQAIRSNP